MHTEHTGSAPPDAFGPFRVLHQIGAGTLGPVYRGHDTERERLVAVKLFKLDLPPDVTHQFVAGLERIVNANLSHPGLAAPIAAGLTNNSAYVAMDYVAAEPVDLTLRELGPLPPADALQLAARVASALDLAVAGGFTHGCLHPRDVLMSSRDTRITGIGIGQLLAKLGVAVPVRRPYTAPERVNGESWDRRCDVFSLAALVHELLWNKRVSGTGSQAVEGMTAVPGGDLDALKRVFKRALAEDPGERHPTPKIFVDALKRALPDVPADVTISLPPAAAAPAPPARNLRLATPSRPAKPAPEPEPLLPLAAPELDVDISEQRRAAPEPGVESVEPGREERRFADLEIEAAPVAAAPNGPSILEDLPEITLPPAFAEAMADTPISVPKPDEAPASDPLALSWLMRDLEGLKTPEPGHIPDLPLVADAIRPDEPPKLDEPPKPEEKTPEPQELRESPELRELREQLSARAARPLREPVVPRDAPKPSVARDAPKHTVARDAPKPTVARDAPNQTVARDAPKHTVAREAPKPPAPVESQDAPREIPVELTMLEKSRSAVWPLLLALVIGAAAGFAGGYAVGVREHPAAVASAAPAAPAPAREFTEGTVPDASKAAAAPAEVRPSAAAATAPIASEKATVSTPPPVAAAPPPKTDPPPAAKPGWKGGRVTVRSTPSGAEVSVDDHDVGRTPTVIRDLTEGPHIIHVERTGYEDHDRRIVLTRERPSQLVNATLARQQPAPPARTPTPFSRTPPPQPAQKAAPAAARQQTAPAGRGSLTVESRPSGARVFLDGKLVGTTPLTWAGIPAGDHGIRLEHDGYSSWTGSVRVVSNETARVTGSLER